MSAINSPEWQADSAFGRDINSGMEMIVPEFTKSAGQRPAILNRPEIFPGNQDFDREKEKDANDGQKSFSVECVFQASRVGKGNGKGITS
jgi:hypothetical protein